MKGDASDHYDICQKLYYGKAGHECTVVITVLLFSYFKRSRPSALLFQSLFLILQVLTATVFTNFESAIKLPML